jgi:hypothetical protein
MNTYALGSAANEGAWRPAAASGLAVSASSAAARSTGGQNAVRNIRHSDVYCFVQCSRSGPMPNHCEDHRRLVVGRTIASASISTRWSPMRPATRTSVLAGLMSPRTRPCAREIASTSASSVM